MVESVLDEVPGLGDVRRKALMRQFGSFKRLKLATVDEVGSVPGFGPRLAEAVVAAVAAHVATVEPAVNVTTGEVLE